MIVPASEFGITQSLRKPVSIACGELSRAINAMSAHHTEEMNAASNAGVEAVPSSDPHRAPSPCRRSIQGP